MRVGMLTGGGDCPGLNAVIRAAVRKGIYHYGDEFVGFMEGWRGVIDDVTMPLNLETTSGAAVDELFFNQGVARVTVYGGAHVGDSVRVVTAPSRTAPSQLKQ